MRALGCEYHQQNQAPAPCFLSCPHPSTPWALLSSFQSSFQNFSSLGIQPVILDSFVLNSYGVSTTPHRLPPPKSPYVEECRGSGGEGHIPAGEWGIGSGPVQQPRGISAGHPAIKEGTSQAGQDRLPPGTCFLWDWPTAPAPTAQIFPQASHVFPPKSHDYGIWFPPTSPVSTQLCHFLSYLPGGRSGPGSPASPK